MVVPVDPSRSSIADGVLQARFERGGVANARLVWIGIRPGQPRSSDVLLSSAFRWMGRPAEWFSLSAPKTPDSDAIGQWVVLITAPSESLGSSLWLDGRRVFPRWSKDPPFESAKALAHGQAFTSDVSPLGRNALNEAARSPFERWRVRLAKGRRVFVPESDAAEDRFSDPALEALAQQIESRWSTGIERLRASDDELAVRVTTRLALMLDFGQGVVVPAWSGSADSDASDPQSQALATLLNDLTEPTLSAQQLAQRASVWLDAQPPAGTFVLDDAGLSDGATRSTLTRIGTANLKGGLVAASVSLAGKSPEIVSIDGLRVVTQSVAIATQVSGALPDSTRASPSDPSGSLVPSAARLAIATGAGVGVGEVPVLEARVRVGEWETPRRIVPLAVKATPPGFVIGPLSPEWTRETLMLSMTDPALTPVTPIAERSWSCGGLVLRDDRASSDARPGDPNAPTSWMVYLECRGVNPSLGTGKDGSSDGQDTVRLYFGATGASRVILAVRPDGALTIEQTNTAGQMPANSAGTQRVRAMRSSDRWSCWVPVPASAIERLGSDFVVRLGVSRIDPRGERSGWPRPMLPWQAEPGRVLIDLTSWGRE